MADFYTNYPAAQKPMTLGEMLNMASGVQNYQQAQQMNPLALQRAQQEVEQARQINPLALRQKQAETTLAEETLQPKIQQQQTITEKGQFELESKKADKSREILSALAQSPAFRAADRNKMIHELADTQQELIRAGFKPNEALLAISALTGKVMQDPKSAVSFLENSVRQGVSPESRLNLQTPQLTTQAGAPALFTSGTATLAPANIAGQLPMPQQPPMPQSMPQQGMPQQPPQQVPQQPPKGITPTQMSLPYPVRPAGDIRPLAPAEQQDKEAGFAYRDSLSKATQKLSVSLRNLDEVIKKAGEVGENEWMGGAGILGSAGRNLSVFLGTEQGVNYKRLSKDLANLQISLGADTSTDAGKQLLAAASGDITLPPDVLQEIARRTRADRQNIEMQSQGAQVFSQKYGDANLKKFQKDWTDNSKDTKVLEAISIYNSDMSENDKKEQINKLFAGASPQYIEKVKQYRRNLENLSKTGGL
jgi:hypothetical protein